MDSADKGFHALHYTYIRQSDNLFPRILATPTNIFIDHVEKFTKAYRIISPQQVSDYYRNDLRLDKTGLLFTFDDGYSDHYRAAKILHSYGIRALFFIPTCVLTENLPINPTIIHYGLAKYGTRVFLDAMEVSAKKLGIKIPALKYERGDNYWPVIAEIKKISKYSLPPEESRRLFLDVYETTLRQEFKNIMNIMYMNVEQIKEVLAMGHSIGTHTNNHFSLGSAALSEQQREEEIISSGQVLEKIFTVPVKALAYPYGEPADCLSENQLLRITKNYDMAFTVVEKINKANSSPLEIGRYAPTSKDTADDIQMKLLRIANH